MRCSGGAYFIGWCTGYDTSFCLALACAAEQLDLLLALGLDGLCAGSQQLAGVEALALLILALFDVLAGSLSKHLPGTALIISVASISMRRR